MSSYFICVVCKCPHEKLEWDFFKNLFPKINSFNFVDFWHKISSCIHIYYNLLLKATSVYFCFLNKNIWNMLLIDDSICKPWEISFPEHSWYFFNYTLNIAIIGGNFLSEVLGGVFSLFILSRFELISLSL